MGRRNERASLIGSVHLFAPIYPSLVIGSVHGGVIDRFRPRSSFDRHPDGHPCHAAQWQSVKSCDSKLHSLHGSYSTADRMWATVVRPKPDKAFILLDLDGYPQLPGMSAAMLYHTAMSTPLKESLLTGQVSVGDRVFVEVLLVRPDLKRPGKVQVHVREIPPDPGSGLPMEAIAPVPEED